MEASRVPAPFTHEERFAHINESWMSEHKGQIAVLSGVTLYTHTNTA